MNAIFLRLVNMSIAASWIVLVVVALRLLLWRAPKWINCLLWAVVGLRLVTPFPLKSIFSLVPQVDARNIPDLGNLGGLGNPGGPSGLGGQGTPNVPIPAPAAGTSPAAPDVGNIAAGQAPDLLGILSAVWLAGCVAMLAYALLSYLRLHRRVGASIRLGENIFVCDDIASPFLLGVLRPRIYLPSGISEDQLPYILAHERAHMKRKDHLWKPLGFSLLAVYWFNPVLWLAYLLFCRDIELACDQKVIRRMGRGAKRAYSQALLSCAAPRRMVLISPLAFGEVGIKKRVKSVLYYRRPAFWITLAAVVACIVVGVCFLTDPYGTEDAPPEDGSFSDDAIISDDTGGNQDITGTPGDDDSIPQADVALVREIVFAYGAEEDTYNYDQPTIVRKSKSLFFLDESWSGENGLTPFYYLYWEDSQPATDEEWAAIEAGQQYAEGRQGESPFGYRYIGPGEMVEAKIMAHFEVTPEHLQSDPEYYDGSIPGYFMMSGGGMGERPTVSFTYEQEGDILTVPVMITPPDYSDEPETIHTLTVRLEPGGGWKYLGCQVS